MECTACKSDMIFIHCDDTGSSGVISYAHNLYYCEPCMIYVKENVWEKPGKLTIFPDNSIILEETEKST